MTPPTMTPPAMTQRQKTISLYVCLLTIVMAVIDNNIVSAAVVPIVRDLDPVNGVDRLPWLVSAFALAATAMLPLYGRLCDVFGPKRVYLGAVATFLAGSALCGVAQSFGQLIAFRAVQGIGAGGLMSVTMVVMAHLMPPDQRTGGNAGGLVAGAGMAVGPFLGGLLAEHAGWRWIFYVNIPLGVVILTLAGLLLKLPHDRRTRTIDYPGAGLAAAFAVALLLISEWGGKQYAWTSAPLLGLVAGALVLLGLFLWRQATAAEPILPLSLLRDRTIAISLAIQGIVGAAMLGAMLYLMLYLQIARGVPAATAGTYLIPMALGLGLVGLVAGRYAGRGPAQRRLLLGGTVIGTLAVAGMSTMDADTDLWVVRGLLFALGIGFGQLLGLLITVVQQAAPRAQLGVATTAIRFFQSLGGALGVAVLGAVLTHAFAARTPGVATSAIPTLTGAAHDAAVDSFVHGLTEVFVVAAALMGVTVVLALLIKLPGSDVEDDGVRPGVDALDQHEALEPSGLDGRAARA
ncbi:MFS transporter [Hamadaea tsunoensis]|uniref:MFS transporter n=1 Tax=Hamadaea tsunoensis TaxID=53368 RepID=UPI001B7FA383|nr:MFS transporter [Hamadaea tsunoensis]